MRVQHRLVHKSRRNVYFPNVSQFEHQTLGRWNRGVYSEREVKSSMISALLTVLTQRLRALNISS
jgi:hypothetical protein